MTGPLVGLPELDATSALAVAVGMALGMGVGEPSSAGLRHGMRLRVVRLGCNGGSGSLCFWPLRVTTRTSGATNALAGNYPPTAMTPQRASERGGQKIWRRSPPYPIGG